MTSDMKKNDNYLDHVFRRSPEVDWDEVTEEDKDDTHLPLVVLHIRHRGLSHFIAEKFFDRPPVTHVHMEPIGSYIWRQIDGQHSVYEIGQLLHETFGEEAEPLYERLSVYMKQLENNGLIID